MTLQTQSRAHTPLDWAVVVTVTVPIVWITSSALRDAPVDMKAVFPIAAPFSMLACALVVVWMVKGGAKSQLWHWLPPFWPWGRAVTSPSGRWLVVLAMVGGSVAGTAIYLFGNGVT